MGLMQGPGPGTRGSGGFSAVLGPLEDFPPSRGLWRPDQGGVHMCGPSTWLAKCCPTSALDASGPPRAQTPALLHTPGLLWGAMIPGSPKTLA